MISRANTDELKQFFLKEFRTGQCLLDLDYTMQVPITSSMIVCVVVTGLQLVS